MVAMVTLEKTLHHGQHVPTTSTLCLEPLKRKDFDPFGLSESSSTCHYSFDAVTLFVNLICAFFLNYLISSFLYLNETISNIYHVSKRIYQQYIRLIIYFVYIFSINIFEINHYMIGLSIRETNNESTVFCLSLLE